MRRAAAAATRSQTSGYGASRRVFFFNLAVCSQICPTAQPLQVDTAGAALTKIIENSS